ncbi:MAG TPA: hypothetical protein VGL14_11960 [Methylomirabilota bacterium]
MEAVLNRLQANATVQQRLAAFAANLRAQGYNVTTAIDVRRYDSGVCLETFVDVERPAPARSVCWWCEVVPIDGRWRIESYVIQTAQGGQDDLEDFAKIDVESSDGVDAAFEAAVGRLLQSERWNRYVD